MSWTHFSFNEGPFGFIIAFGSAEQYLGESLIETAERIDLLSRRLGFEIPEDRTTVVQVYYTHTNERESILFLN